MGKKIAFLLTLCALVLCIVFAWDIIGQKEVDGTKGLLYELTDDGTGYIVSDIGWAKDTEIIVPTVYRGKPVVEIGTAAFSGRRDVTAIKFQEGNSIKHIGKRAFGSCEKLLEIEIPTGVTVISQDAFSGCKNLKKVVLHENVTSIEWSAFSGCESLSSITLPNSLEQLGHWAFSRSGLRYVAIPSSLTKVSQYAFHESRSLVSVTLPSSVTDIGRSAFSYCVCLEDFYFDGTKDQWKAIEKGAEWNQKTPSYTVHCTDGNIKK